MRVAGITLKANNRHIIDSVYRPAGTAEFGKLFDDPTSWVHASVTMSRQSDYLYRTAALIGYIHYRTRALIASIVNLLSDNTIYDEERVASLPSVEVTASRPDALTDEMRHRCVYLLNNMYSCTPNQGFWTAGTQQRAMSCDQYRLCPWCRYRKSLEMFNALSFLFPSEGAEARDICVTHFMSICDPMALDLNSPAQAYQKVARSIADNRDWLGDYVVTLPRQVRTDVYGDDAARYEMVWRTSLIAITEHGFDLPLPEALSPMKIEGAHFISDGVVYRYPAEPAGLRDAFKTVMGYPKFMLSSELTDELLGIILTVLSAGDRNRAVPHGLRQTATEESPAEQTD